MDPLFVRSLTKFALLCVPAIIVLLVWQRRGVVNRTLYTATWLNVVVSVLWLAALAGRFISAASLFVFWPFFLAIASVFICVLPTASAERKFLIYANGLMILWWGMLVAMPN